MLIGLTVIVFLKPVVGCDSDFLSEEAENIEGVSLRLPHIARYGMGDRSLLGHLFFGRSEPLGRVTTLLICLFLCGTYSFAYYFVYCCAYSFPFSLAYFFAVLRFNAPFLVSRYALPWDRLLR